MNVFQRKQLDDSDVDAIKGTDLYAALVVNCVVIEFNDDEVEDLDALLQQMVDILEKQSHSVFHIYTKSLDQGSVRLHFADPRDMLSILS